MPTYDVKFPDGHVQTFVGPEMSDSDAYTRAIQERAIAEGRIPTTWWKGFGKALGEDAPTTGALVTATGMGLQGLGAAAAPETGGASLALLPVGKAVMASAPLASNFIRYGTQRATGQNPEAPTPIAIARDAAIGAAGVYGPELAGQAAHLVASHLPTTGIGGALARLSGAGPVSEVVDAAAQPVAKATSGETVKDIVDRLRALATQARGGVTADDVKLVTEQIQKGMNPSTAFKVVGQGDANKIAALKTLYLRARAAARLARP